MKKATKIIAGVSALGAGIIGALGLKKHVKNENMERCSFDNPTLIVRTNCSGDECNKCTEPTKRLSGWGTEYAPPYFIRKHFNTYECENTSCPKNPNYKKEYTKEDIEEDHDIFGNVVHYAKENSSKEEMYHDILEYRRDLLYSINHASKIEDVQKSIKDSLKNLMPYIKDEGAQNIIEYMYLRISESIYLAEMIQDAIRPVKFPVMDIKPECEKFNIPFEKENMAEKRYDEEFNKILAETRNLFINNKKEPEHSKYYWDDDRNR